MEKPRSSKIKRFPSNSKPDLNRLSHQRNNPDTIDIALAASVSWTMADCRWLCNVRRYKAQSHITQASPIAYTSGWQ